MQRNLEIYAKEFRKPCKGITSEPSSAETIPLESRKIKPDSGRPGVGIFQPSSSVDTDNTISDPSHGKPGKLQPSSSVDPDDTIPGPSAGTPSDSSEAAGGSHLEICPVCDLRKVDNEDNADLPDVCQCKPGVSPSHSSTPTPEMSDDSMELEELPIRARCPHYHPPVEVRRDLKFWFKKTKYYIFGLFVFTICLMLFLVIYFAMELENLKSEHVYIEVGKSEVMFPKKLMRDRILMEALKNYSEDDEEP